jgi:hypothetical protein
LQPLSLGSHVFFYNLKGIAMKIDVEFSKIEKIKELYCLFKKPMKLGLSFWGTRFITIEGYEGKLPLAKLVRKVDDIDLYVNNNFSLIERLWYGRKVMFKIDGLYKESAKLVESCNIITYILFLLQNWLYGDSYFEWVNGNYVYGRKGRNTFELLFD